MCGRGCTLEGGNPGVSLPLHDVWERMYTGGGNPGVSLPLHNVWERMYAGGGKSWGVPTSEYCVGEDTLLFFFPMKNRKNPMKTPMKTVSWEYHRL